LTVVEEFGVELFTFSLYRWKVSRFKLCLIDSVSAHRDGIVLLDGFIPTVLCNIFINEALARDLDVVLGLADVDSIKFCDGAEVVQGDCQPFAGLSDDDGCGDGWLSAGDSKVVDLLDTFFVGR
jgi:hypothetical protein